MTSNQLFLNRLIIYTVRGEIAYDEQFHKGVNIIRGDNSSGKSTITHFIFYALGGAFKGWVKEARQCSMVIAEIEVNGATIVIRRELHFNEEGKANPLEPMYIFWGSIDETQTGDGWQRFNFSTTPGKASFSNVLFDALDIPIVKGENNITMHQILRLMYIDQESPTSSLFLYEQFDTSFTRDTVAELLLGVYSQALYDRKQEKMDVDKKIELTKHEVKTLKDFNSPETLIPASLLALIDDRNKTIADIDRNIEELRNEQIISRYSAKTKLEFEQLNQKAINQREEVNRIDNSVSEYATEIRDSEEFISEIESKIKAIRNSIETRSVLGEFNIEYCPQCLSKLSAVDNDELCKLCHNPIDNSFGITQAKKIEQELGFQVKESKQILEKKKRHLADLQISYGSAKVVLSQIQRQVNQSIKDVRTLTSERIDKLLVDKGYYEGEIIQFKTMLETAEKYQELLLHLAELEIRQKNLKVFIEAYIEKQKNEKERINNIIDGKALYLLKNDLKREREFSEAQEFHIDYGNNIAFITDRNEKYSASSNFYLKTAARFAIFLASIENPQMRFPRYIFSDNMEDKGIEEKRAQNFQKILVDVVEKTGADNYQLIYTTSFIPDELNIDKYTVGDYYTESNKSLRHIIE
jgi:hypothetical protein